MVASDAAQFQMFTNNIGTSASTEPQFEIQKTNASHFKDITKELKQIMKKSLKRDRWEGINLHEAKNYTHDNVLDRWTIEKNKWLNVSRYWI